MPYKDQTKEIIARIQKLAAFERKLTGFTIGNTAKKDKNGLYFTPIRNTTLMVTAGVIVYHERQAVEIAKIADGKVHYILVDAEKKIPGSQQARGVLANVERAVRETVEKSKLWIYKGNDLSAEAVDCFLMQLTKNSLRGIGGKKITILGAGNLGVKLALKLVERGAHVTITRRDKENLEIITKAINCIKPEFTQAAVVGMTDNHEAAKGAEILIGTSRGIPLVTSKIVKDLASKAIIIDAGKGVIFPDAIKVAKKLGMEVYRLDISAAFEGLIHKLWAVENIVENKLGRRQFDDESIISGGLLGQEGEIVVDNVWKPKLIYGIADGNGDFVRNLSKQQMQRLEKLRRAIEG